MATQGQRQNFMWRPNTNDSTTLARYDQEAQHWVKAFKSASAPKPNFLNALGVVGLVLSLVINLVWLLVFALGKFFTWAFSGSESGDTNKKFDMPLPPSFPTKDVLDKKFNTDNITDINIYE